MQPNQRRLRLRLRVDRFDRLARKTLDVDTDMAVAVQLGINPATLSALRNRHVQPSERFIVAALDGIGCRFEDIFEITNEPAGSTAA